MKFKNAFAVGLMCAVLGGTLAGCSSTPTNESTGQYVDSSAVTTKVKTALLATKGIDSNSITVNTYKSTVQLSGFVDTQAQKNLAGQTAANVTGVQRVINNIIVRTNS
ncbi:MAG: transport-associated protein [Gammaproteobacteria bacterium]|jgi:osmotically-inducible protein OsmY|nr:transport-associated protein [Gammaproteobacteria bacterium]